MDKLWNEIKRLADSNNGFLEQVILKLPESAGWCFENM